MTILFVHKCLCTQSQLQLFTNKQRMNNISLLLVILLVFVVYQVILIFLSSDNNFFQIPSVDFVLIMFPY